MVEQVFRVLIKRYRLLLEEFPSDSLRVLFITLPEREDGGPFLTCLLFTNDLVIIQVGSYPSSNQIFFVSPCTQTHTGHRGKLSWGPRRRYLPGVLCVDSGNGSLQPLLTKRPPSVPWKIWRTEYSFNWVPFLRDPLRQRVVGSFLYQDEMIRDLDVNYHYLREKGV